MSMSIFKPTFLSTILGLLFFAGALAVEIPPGFRAETIATNLNAATAIAVTPDERVFIADQTGKVSLWKEGAGVLPSPALTLHVTDYWERGLIGMALDPEFLKRPEIVLLYVTDRPFVHHVLSRFTVRGDEIDAASEKILFEGDDQANMGGPVPAGHQGGALRFGHDGKLYVSIGEQTASDQAQSLETIQGKILRLNRDGTIPEDNPFATKTTGKYRAIYAYGVRNSFGIAAQPLAEGGRIFFTDVGASSWEEVNELQAGANYGWPQAEGFSTNSNFKNPLYAYPPLIGQSIVGAAFLPRAFFWPEKWGGRFFFADFMKHWVRALDPANPTNVVTFARGLNGPIAIEFSAMRSMFVLKRSTVWRDPAKFVTNAGSLVRIRYTGEIANDEKVTETGALGLPLRASRLPRRILREDWEQRLRGAGEKVFELLDSEWQPFVRVATRAFLPPGRVTVEADGAMTFPIGTVFVREFFGGDQLIERRLHVVSAPEDYGASYRVNPRGDGELVEDGEAVTIGNQSWWLPALEPRLSRPLTSPLYSVPKTVAEWNASNGTWKETAWDKLGRLGWIRGAFGPFPKFVDWRSSTEQAGLRVRAYLHANCSVCHQPGGASRGLFDARVATPLEKTGLINGPLAAGDLGIPGAKVVVPGAPEKSILVRRLRDPAFFRMPPTQTHNEVSPIVPVMEEWIRGLEQ